MPDDLEHNTAGNGGEVVENRLTRRSIGRWHKGGDWRRWGGGAALLEAKCSISTANCWLVMTTDLLVLEEELAAPDCGHGWWTTGESWKGDGLDEAWGCSGSGMSAVRFLTRRRRESQVGWGGILYARKIRSLRQSLTSNVWYERGWTQRKRGEVSEARYM